MAPFSKVHVMDFSLNTVEMSHTAYYWQILPLFSIMPTTSIGIFIYGGRMICFYATTILIYLFEIIEDSLAIANFPNQYWKHQKS